MKRKILGASAILILLLAVFWSRKCGGLTGPGGSNVAGGNWEPGIAEIFSSNIHFFGKALDEDGNAIPGANVEITIDQVPFGRAKKEALTTDGDGKFELHSRGAAITVLVTKNGYHEYPGHGPPGSRKSSAGFNFGRSTEAVFNPDANNPEVFHLLRAKPSGNVVSINFLRIKAKRSGKVFRVEVPLKNRKGSGHFIEVAMFDDYPDDTKESPNVRRNWGFEIAVPGGGIQPVPGQMMFEAAEGGYSGKVREEIRVDDSTKKWDSFWERSFWVRFPGEFYARVNFTAQLGYSSTGPMLSFDGVINLEAGNRRLERPIMK